MIGLSELKRLRLNRYAPKAVWVHVLENPAPMWLVRDSQEAIANGCLPGLLLDPLESITSLDLSPVYGLVVHVIGNDPGRTKHVAKELSRYSPWVIASIPGELLELKK